VTISKMTRQFWLSGLCISSPKIGAFRVTLQSLPGSARARIPIQVDIGFGDAITPVPIDIEYPTILDFDAPRLKSYPQETVVAEKYQAMVLLGITNSRIKDFFDFWLLARQFQFDGRVLSEAIFHTFANRRTKMIDNPVAWSDTFTTDPVKQTQWEGFCRKSKIDFAPEHLRDLVAGLRQFLHPITKSLVTDKKFSGQWIPPGPWETD
jgi:hypothetical protein